MSGCGPATIKRYHISGVVTFEGKPVPKGTITFEPVGRDVMGGFANIIDGSYDTAQEGVGQVSGEHTVIITGDATMSVKPDSFQADSYVAKPLFPKFQTTAKLPRSASKLDFEVPKVVKKVK